jgi:uncharacterized protein YjeT (DUF2065 family)
VRYVARGYATPGLNDQNVLCSLLITQEQYDTGEGLSPDYWWEFEAHPNRWERLIERIPSQPTRASRNIGIGIVITGLLFILLVVGALESQAARYPDRELFRVEWSLWKGLPAIDRAYYCQMPRVGAVEVWAGAMSEGPYWDAPHAQQARVARHVLRRGCNV